MRARFLLAVAVMAPGCGRSASFELTSREPADAGGVRDAGLAPDAGTSRDGGSSRDAGAVPDAGPAFTPAVASLTCGLHRDRALQAALQMVDCSENLTVRGVMEAWEGFVLGSFDPYAAELAPIPNGCQVWRCAARAGSCAGLDACLRANRLSDDDCRVRDRRCFGDRVGVCLGSVGYVPHRDCGALGAECRQGACVFDGCRADREPWTCSDTGDILICDGAVRVDCSRWDPGSACAGFAVGGEIPVPWCSPTGEIRAGAYPTPVDCDDGAITFTTVGGRSYEVDCRAAGYAGCTDRGCTR